ncbi:hypothetical protein M9458_026011, partial [Cirrhinus mrigala]
QLCLGSSPPPTGSALVGHRSTIGMDFWAFGCSFPLALPLSLLAPTQAPPLSWILIIAWFLQLCSSAWVSTSTYSTSVGHLPGPWLLLRSVLLWVTSLLAVSWLTVGCGPPSVPPWFISTSAPP